MYFRLARFCKIHFIVIVANLSCDVAEALQALAVGADECLFIVIIEERACRVFLVIDALKIIFLRIENQSAMLGCSDEDVALLVFEEADAEWIGADVGQVFVDSVVLVETQHSARLFGYPETLLTVFEHFLDRCSRKRHIKVADHRMTIVGNGHLAEHVARNHDVAIMTLNEVVDQMSAFLT